MLERVELLYVDHTSTFSVDTNGRDDLGLWRCGTLENPYSASHRKTPRLSAVDSCSKDGDRDQAIHSCPFSSMCIDHIS